MLTAFSAAAIACDCGGEPYRPGVTMDQIRKEKREYFLTGFQGAAFIGKIVKRERVNVKWIAKTMDGEPTNFQMYKYTIRVRDYWLGVTSPTVTVFGEPEEQVHGNFSSWSSCGFSLEKGQTYFFTPRFNQNNLQIGQCDFAGEGSPPNERQAAEFRRIMGEPKRF